MSLKDKIRILVVDDMATSRGLIIQTLETVGVKNFDYCKNGADAVKSIAVKPVHLVISDYNMPEMDGLGLLKALRANEKTQRIGFILVTGSEDPDVVSKGQKLGMNNYLKKPFTPETMRSCIEAVVGKL